MKLRAITVDFWGTLLFDHPGSDERYKRRRLASFEQILQQVGVQVSCSDLSRAYERSGTYLRDIWSHHRDVAVTQHVFAILDAIAPDLRSRLSGDVVDRLVEAYATPALLVPPTVDHTALAALDTLSREGYALAIVSNTMRTPGTTLRRLLEHYGLLQYFKHVTFSDEAGVRKPDPAIFTLTLQAIGVDAEVAVHVGDDDVLDVQGARAAGMRVIQVTGASPAVSGNGADAVISRLEGLPEAVARLERSPR